MDEKKRQRAGAAGLPRTEAAIRAYAETGETTDPLGMWTGRPHMENGLQLHPDVREGKAERPVQDADDL